MMFFDANNQEKTDFPRVLGTIYDVAYHPQYGWFIAGNFTHINGVKRKYIARIKTDLTLDMNWNPIVDGEVRSIAVNEDFVYFGGNFSKVSDQTRYHIAAVGVADGVLSDWNPGADGIVYDMIVSSNTLIIGGQFTEIAGEERFSLGSIDISSGNATAWAPHVTYSENNPGIVYAIVVSSNNVYIGGEFFYLGGVERQHCGAVDMASGAVNPFNPWPNTIVFSLYVKNSTLYIGGMFTQIFSQVRNRLAAYSLSLNQLNSWDPNIDSYNTFPNANSSVRAISVLGDKILVGGIFTKVGSTSKANYALFDLNTGNLSSITKTPSGSVFTITTASSDNEAIAGGSFDSFSQYITRYRLAAFDAQTGALRDWAPVVDGAVTSIEVFENTVLIGGYFNKVNNISRPYAASLIGYGATGSGQLNNWAPGLNGIVSQLLIAGESLYIRGSFTSVSENNRLNIALFDLNTMQLRQTSLQIPYPTSYLTLRAMGAVDSVLMLGIQYFEGNSFKSVLSEFNTRTGQEIRNSPTNKTINAITATSSVIYLGGYFTQVKGVYRSGAAALDRKTGEIKAWDAKLSGGLGLTKMVTAGNYIYMTGDFDSVGAIPQSGFTKIDMISGVCSPMGHTYNGSIAGMDINEQNIYIGGSFSHFNFLSNNDFTVIQDSTILVPPKNPMCSPSLELDRVIDLSWTKSSGATYYKIYRGLSSFFDTTGNCIATVGDVNTYRDTLGGYIKYYYKIGAFSEGNFSKLSAIASATAPDFIAPEANIGLLVPGFGTHVKIVVTSNESLKSMIVNINNSSVTMSQSGSLFFGGYTIQQAGQLTITATAKDQSNNTTSLEKSFNVQTIGRPFYNDLYKITVSGSDGYFLTTDDDKSFSGSDDLIPLQKPKTFLTTSIPSQIALAFTEYEITALSGLKKRQNFTNSAIGLYAQIGDERILLAKGGDYTNSVVLEKSVQDKLISLLSTCGLTIAAFYNPDFEGIPTEFALSQNYPNPFNPRTTIRYDVAKAGKVVIKVYNMLGQEVATLINAQRDPGRYSIQWDGRNNAGSVVASGVYLYRMQVGDVVRSKRMLFLK
ncbi:MAG TPA: T9SS type A sorting domain-containing protein [bacterium]|nr:T9SS type A sorting domain-containing protein [bacterium]HNB08726.1 T9SS type A sorting domain-containing protein [bacterium]HNH29527.1 T9SS type A sorting domain-containing protein [bacterium]HNH33238.1 T9SS type A sorting domain-containing protein [bacterium]